MSPDQVEIWKAVLATLATITTAVMIFLGVIVSSRRTSQTKAVIKDSEGGSKLGEFDGTQNEFMALVIAENRRLFEGQENQNRVLKEQNTQIEELKGMVESIKEHQDSFLGAVRRYLIKLAHHWAGPEPMPWPDTEDFHILEDTLPTRGGENERTE